MCGIFAYAGPGPADRELLALAAAEAARRGPHGYGWVSVPGGAGYAGPKATWRLGALNGDLGRIARLDGSRVLGHFRLATQGAAAEDPAGLQPVGADGHWLAHNGNVYNPAQLCPGAVTDSAALAAAYAAERSAGAGPRAALAAAVARADIRSSAVVVLDSSGTLLGWRRRLPLFCLERGGRVYLGSRPFGPAAPVAEEVVLSWAGITAGAATR